MVWAGHNPGVYDDWSDCKEQVVNFPGARYKSFPSPEAAAAAYRSGAATDDAGQLASLVLGNASHRQAKKSIPPKKDYIYNPEINLSGWAVDAACAHNPGPVEYRGVELATGRQIFHIGPLQEGTNNLGEFLAIVHALALQKKMGINVPIYSDSLTGISWVRKRLIKTTVRQTPQNTPLFDLLRRAMNWLNTNTYSTPIYKWDTDRWGEIPADFGRK